VAIFEILTLCAVAADGKNRSQMAHDYLRISS